jgi:hypothetical protein
MATTTDGAKGSTEESPIGYGSMERKEDARFIPARGSTSTTSSCPGSERAIQ